MSSTDSREIDAHDPPRSRKQSKGDPPHFHQKLRIVLLGKSASENCLVGNFILGRSALDREAPPDVVERVGGRLKDRPVTLINSPHLLQTNISDHQITQTLRECVSLSDPGPHVIILILNPPCSAGDGERLEELRDSFSDQMFQHSLVISTREPTETDETLQEILQRCSHRHFSLQTSSSPEEILEMCEEIERSNDGRHLVCVQHEDTQEITVKQQAIERFPGGVKLNLVLCGCDSTLKSSISEQIQQQKDKDLHGCLIHLLELPTLIHSGLSEQEVMRETLRCVSLCHPGVHVFLLIIPDAPLNNEDKAEMEEIQRIFSSRINRHVMILIKQSSERQTAELNEETQAVLQSFGGRHHFIGPKTHVSTLMEKIEEMLEQNRGDVYSTETFLETQMKNLIKYEEMKKKLNSLEANLLSQGSAESEDDIRIVLLGKTGVGKSSTGNTILGRDAFKAEESFESVTSESQRESCELNGRHVTVIDTPGLFDTEVSNEEIRREISHCISMMLPGPHVFLLLIPLGRFTKEEQESVKIIQETFGEHSLRFTMVLFTRGDFLKNKSIEECLGKPGSVIRKLTEACGNRVHVFNNNQTGDPTQVYELLEKIDNMVEENGGSFYSCKMFREMERERQERQMKILMDRVREKEEEMKTLEEEKERMRRMMEEERQYQDKERKRREEEFIKKKEQYKKQIKEKEEKTQEICEKMKREQEQWEKQKLEEKTRGEQIEEKREREKLIFDGQIQKLQSEMEGIKREKEKIERERQEQLEGLEKRLEEEKDLREDQEKTFEEKLKLCEKQHEDELKRRRVEWREENERDKQEMSKMMKICSETDASLQFTAYNKLTTEFNKWTWSLRRAMRETENNLHNRISNEEIHEVQETDLYTELKETSEEVEKSVLEFFEKNKDKYILLQWKMSFEIKIKEIQENIVRETRRKLNEILQQRDLKKKIDAQRTHHENTLYEKSKELALNLKDQRNEETLKKEFDLFWEQSVNMIIRDTPVIRDIDLKRDVKNLISDVYEDIQVHHRMESRDIFSASSYRNYIRKNRNDHKHSFFRYFTNLFNPLSDEEEEKIGSFVTDVSLQTDRQIQSFNISEMGYNISCIQQLIEYIKTRVTEHQEQTKEYVFEDKFFMDLVFSVCNRANKMISDQHRLFREANDPLLYLEEKKKKREEYYSIFQKYCDGATSAVILGEIICQKLKYPIEQNVYKKTSRDLADEMRSNCKSLNRNRSNLEKLILKTLAEEEDFNKYMNYIHNPRDHFKSFIRDEVSRYIRDKFSVSVLPKMKENIELLQKKILTAAHESTEHVQLNSGDVHLWMKSFTQKLSGHLIFSNRHLSGVKHEKVEDFKLLEDVMRKVLPVTMANICGRFNTKTFPSKLDFKFRPDEVLIDLFCRCCWVQCPFCKAICTNTIENHDGDHSVPLHRVAAVNGTYFKCTQNLCVDTCQNLVAYGLNCEKLKGNLVWKEMKIAGPKSAIWSITSDRSLLTYWKWFVCRFQKDLEGYYSKTFVEKGKIPDEWKNYSKQEAIRSLDQYI